MSALSRKERPIGDPAYEHLTKCSPCYREFRALQGAQAPQPAVGTFKWVVAAAAVLVALVSGWFFFVAQERAVPTGQLASQELQTAEISAQLDLRKYTVARTEQQQAQAGPVSLTRAKSNLTILLPAGSEPGGYELQVLDSGLRSQASGTGDAEIRDFVTTLTTTLDLRALSPGAYQLALRRHGDEWHLFPAEVK